MEHGGGLSRQEAEYEAAERLHLLAFMDIRAHVQNEHIGGGEKYRHK